MKEQEMSSGPGYPQIIHFDTDIRDSREQHSYVEEGGVPGDAFAELAKEAERFLEGKVLPSTERIEELMTELEEALLINNNPKIAALYKDFKKTFRPEILG